ncbi:MAG: WbqC family protein, partial [Alistipes sp.]|nr:WbqC family protein [Alistipes sp.]
MVILPTAYMPSVEYVARLLREECVIDLGENYVKRSQRNRASILSANGVMQLTVHVENANRPRQPMRDVRIDYSKRWQHQHWVSILSAYKSSPYFDHFASELEPFYRREWRFLVDITGLFAVTTQTNAGFSAKFTAISMMLNYFSEHKVQK